MGSKQIYYHCVVGDLLFLLDYNSASILGLAISLGTAKQIALPWFSGKANIYLLIYKIDESHGIRVRVV